MNNIDYSKLGSIDYGQSEEQRLKEKYIGMKIVDVTYSYFAEGFTFILENGETIFME